MTQDRNQQARWWWWRRCRLRVSSCVFFLLSLLIFALCVTSAQEAGAKQGDERKGEDDTGRVKARREGVISGVVLTDGGQPIPGAIVSFVRVGAVNTRPPDTITDEAGKFSVTGLNSGAYAVSAYAPGYAFSPPRLGAEEAHYYRLGDFITVTLAKGGVITGTVTNAKGEPVVGTNVYATLVRDEAGREFSDRPFMWMQERPTDDRGIYRIFGLDAGKYVVHVGGGNYYGQPTPHDRDVPTYHPSATRDAATEITVRGGEEVGGVDLRHRGEPGHAVSGRISGTGLSLPGGGWNFVSIQLHRAGNTSPDSVTFMQPDGESQGFGFAFHGVPDGDYEITAEPGSGAGAGMSSAPLRVQVKGSDVTGLVLTLAPLGSISGNVKLERVQPPAALPPSCAQKQTYRVEEVVLVARSYQVKGRSQSAQAATAKRRQVAAANQDGDFTLINLAPGQYFLSALLPNSGWFIRSIQNANATTSASAGSLQLGMSERRTGIKVVIAEGAATLGGMVSAPEGKPLPAGLRLYLTPADRAHADDPLRYYEKSAGLNGEFIFSNVAPSKYYLLTKTQKDESRDAAPIGWNASARQALRKDAEAANKTVDLQPCQNTKDHKILVEGKK